MSTEAPMVYIVEDDGSHRTSIERLLRAAGFETVAFESAEDFLQVPQLHRPACLLLDIQLPSMDGIELQALLNARGITLPVVFMTGHGSIQMGVQAMKRGAVDFLPKPFDTTELQAAILAAIARDSEILHREREVEEARALIATLTPREHEVLRWVIAGRLNKQIAFSLGTTEKTVKVHRAHVMQKTGVASVADLVVAVGINRRELADYVSLDESPVQIIFMVAARDDQHAPYLKTLAAISTLMKSPGFRDALLAAPDAPSAFELLTNRRVQPE